ncbi:SMP-30/gluconolactonase/LRE family protein [Pedobacter sp. AK017]|uniref:SMP-30/gluconolactonase/LRE family protein n=1 Tax=Pedobacter sp. AK017 TaxID=2723073 RepID=UPI00160EAC30|nr:SMP-30/gluconolactonase/LRE family protein [Pedobacter sp. AK017]
MRAPFQIDIVSKHRCQLGECPVWDVKKQVICWIDILRGEIHQYSPVDSTHVKLAVPPLTGSMALCKDGNFIAALRSGISFIDRKTAEIKFISNPETHLPFNRFNEGKCDPEGRFWVGTMSLTDEEKKGSVYALDEKLKIDKKITEVSISNGLAWSGDKKTLYYIDTPTFEIVSYDYDSSTGTITNRKVVIKVSEKDGYPDGMTIDNEGMLWVAHWDGWQITRWDPINGEKLLSIPMPVARVTSCTFGGKNLNDLYVTSARTGLSTSDLKKQPEAGAIFVIRNSSFKGLPAIEFNY